jgi:TfoX/Sxy family transcriptional regulator of competence genes
MFSLISAVTESMALRLPKEGREAFLKKYQSKLFEVSGAVMKECVTVPDALLKNTKELQKYMALSYEYAKTLKPKASRKKR